MGKGAGNFHPLKTV